MDDLWVLRLSCCGLDDGYVTFGSWAAAEEFRESYTSGVAVHKNGYSAPDWESGHKRAGVLSLISMTARLAASTPTEQTYPDSGRIG